MEARDDVVVTDDVTTTPPTSPPLAAYGAALIFATVCLGAIVHVLLRPRRRQRAGTVPLRVSPSGQLSCMLVQSRKHPERWTFPAGGVERGERVEQAAQRETREEAGLVGHLGRRICTASDPKATTSMFALYVEAELDTWDEDGERLRRWFDLGVPNSPTASRCFADVRARLVNKPWQQQVLSACERNFAELAREAEQCEGRWGKPRQGKRGMVR
jgi:ADP-ribose pyrophosphatase YjhB (NUDIX family)